jgi:hypothetical protein
MLRGFGALAVDGARDAEVVALRLQPARVGDDVLRARSAAGTAGNAASAGSGGALLVAKLARQAGTEVAHLAVNLGVGGAMRTGFRYALAVTTRWSRSTRTVSTILEK